MIEVDSTVSHKSKMWTIIDIEPDCITLQSGKLFTITTSEKVTAECPHCQGESEVIAHQHDADYWTHKPCPVCNGWGAVYLSEIW